MHHHSSPHRSAWLARRRALEAAGGRFTPDGHKPEKLLSRLLSPPVLRWATRLPLSGGRRNAGTIGLSRLRIGFADLPAAFDGFTILHLTDPHVGTHPTVVAQAAAMAAEIPCDLAVLTGDVQELGRPAATEAAAMLAPLTFSLRARHGILGVLGNHDRHDLAHCLERVGIRMLLNEHVVIRRHDQHLVVVGTDDVHRFHTEQAAHALAAAPDGFRIALIHSPEYAVQAERAGVRLYLAGHTHGGQVCLPGGTPVFTATDGPRARAVGRWRLGAMEGFTSRGIGVGLPPVRYNCPGEMALITLAREPVSDGVAADGADGGGRHGAAGPRRHRPSGAR